MTYEELKAALLSRQPVESGGIVYSYVSAIIYRRNDSGGITVTAELYDKCGHSVSSAIPSRINAIEDKPDPTDTEK